MFPLKHSQHPPTFLLCAVNSQAGLHHSFNKVTNSSGRAAWASPSKENICVCFLRSGGRASAFMCSHVSKFGFLIPSLHTLGPSYSDFATFLMLLKTSHPPLCLSSFLGNLLLCCFFMVSASESSSSVLGMEVQNQLQKGRKKGQFKK